MDMALMVGLGMDMAVVGGHKVVVMGLILGIVSCWDPCNMMYLMPHVVDSPLDGSK